MKWRLEVKRPAGWAEIRYYKSERSAKQAAKDVCHFFEKGVVWRITHPGGGTSLFTV